MVEFFGQNENSKVSCYKSNCSGHLNLKSTHLKSGRPKHLITIVHITLVTIETIYVSPSPTKTYLLNRAVTEGQ